MIKKTLRKKLAKHLKGSFLEEVMNVLDENKIVSNLGKTYTKSYISHVYNGRNENTEIENALIVVYQRRKQQSIMIEKEREKFLKQL